MNDNVQNGEVIIDINDLSKAFGDLKVLTNISTQIRKGDVVCVWFTIYGRNVPRQTQTR